MTDREELARLMDMIDWHNMSPLDMADLLMGAGWRRCGQGVTQHCPEAEKMATPDMFWDVEDVERPYSSIGEIAENAGPGLIVEAMTARSLPNVFGFYLPARDDSDSDDHRYFSFATQAEAEEALAKEEKTP